MFACTDLVEAPWTVVKSNDKKRARLEAMRYVLSLISCPDKDERVIGRPDPLIVGPAPLLAESTRLARQPQRAAAPAARRRHERAPSRSLLTSYSAMPAATPAFRDSAGPRIGMRTTASQVSSTSRDRPLPSEPMTSTSGPSARSS